MKKTINEKSNQAVMTFILISANIATLLNIISDLLQKKSIRFILLAVIVWLISMALTLTRKVWAKNHRLVQTFAILMAWVIFPIIWLNSHGALGSMPLYSLFLLVILVYALDNRWRIIVPLVYLIEILLLFKLQLYQPSLFEMFSDYEMIIRNLLISYVIVSIMIFILILILRKHFEAIQTTLIQMAITDDLTGVHNRRYLIDSLVHLKTNHKNTATDFALLFADINDFKHINDTYGHDVGDKVLQCLGTTLNENLRPSDICGRYGGDEFVVIFPNTSIEDAKAISDRLLTQFNNNLKTIIDQPVGLAFGFTTGNDKSVEAILKREDERMYQAKIK